MIHSLEVKCIFIGAFIFLSLFTGDGRIPERLEDLKNKSKFGTLELITMDEEIITINKALLLKESFYLSSKLMKDDITRIKLPLPFSGKNLEITFRFATSKVLPSDSLTFMELTEIMAIATYFQMNSIKPMIERAFLKQAYHNENKLGPMVSTKQFLDDEKNFLVLFFYLEQCMSKHQIEREQLPEMQTEMDPGGVDYNAFVDEVPIYMEQAQEIMEEIEENFFDLDEEDWNGNRYDDDVEYDDLILSRRKANTPPPKKYEEQTSYLSHETTYEEHNYLIDWNNGAIHDYHHSHGQSTKLRFKFINPKQKGFYYLNLGKNLELLPQFDFPENVRLDPAHSNGMYTFYYDGESYTEFILHKDAKHESEPYHKKSSKRIEAMYMKNFEPQLEEDSDTMYPPQIPSQCHSSYISINDYRKYIGSEAGGKTCDLDRNGFTDEYQWFRFEGRAGNRMPHFPVNLKTCNTYQPGWFNGPIPTHGRTAKGKICFTYYGNSCKHGYSSEVTNCGDFYLYKLKNVPNGCVDAHCGFED